MYRFQIRAETQMGESIALVGSTSELGQWDLAKSIRLYTSADLYPLWWMESAIDFQQSLTSPDGQRLEYRYVRLSVDGEAQWESLGANRWVPIDSDLQSKTVVVDDGSFGYGQPYPFGYIEAAADEAAVSGLPLNYDRFAGDRFAELQPEGLKIVVIGSSVAVGHKAWLLRGWVERLGQSLQEKYGHQLVNVSEVGATVSRTIKRFPSVVLPEQPDIIIIALSLGNEGFAYCPPHERRAVQRRFESGLQQLVKMTRQLGASPVLGSVYPHGDYAPEHNWLLRDTHSRMLTWGVPVLDWLTALDDGQGQWREGLSFDPAHPNSRGHRLMYQAIDLSLFQIDKTELAAEKQRWQQPETAIYQDSAGFQISAWIKEKQLRITNASPYSYSIAPYWQELQEALRQARLSPGLYIAEQGAKQGARQAQPETLPFFAVQEDGTIETTLTIPPGSDLKYTSAFDLFSPHNSDLLFYDGNLGILRADEHHLWMVNESDQEFNVHPMWREVRSALKALPAGVYTDPLYPDAPFRTLMIGRHGLESRVKVSPKSAMLFQYKCSLSDISRVAIIPLGDRCAVRMMLYKMEYDGPAFPFDLTRTTQIADVADMIESRFYDMWNPAFLHYSPDAGRVYHSRWTGLSFAHEVEDTDHPQEDMSAVHERMRVRYSARAERFWYTLQNCDQALFVRTGIADRGGVIDLAYKLEKHCQGKPFRLLLLSPQSSDEFSDLAHVLHYDFEFNPDRMYEDLGHWLYCTEVMRGILDSLGVSSKNLFWCPPTPPNATPH
ncbi:MAG: lipase [Drouetiella hepatica Uher 2000/2452]|jgi:lysophospholipase L1-like esterase|uniref:Lipase n=1 Tax=Drouetiella hepatica Uher 2000/2452 TaxID=904376 RepID=A0A951QEI6_9CYAN|nr:lipase [Drouetiella hepatica Uher 2000/2452]